MAGINSRSKGCKAERVAASLFKAWAKKEFARTPSSGGLNWKTTNAKGDIVCTTEGHYFPFCIEVKSHKEIDFSHLLHPKIKNVKVLEFWDQCQRDAKKAKKIPMLLMRYNGMPADYFFLVIEQKVAKLFHDLLPADMVTLRYHDYKTNQPLMIFRSTDFFKTRYKEIKALAKTYLKDEYK